MFTSAVTGAVAGATTAASAVAATPNNQWSTTLMSCESGKAGFEQWAFAIFCLPCASAMAKSKADQSNPVFNFFCWHPVSMYSFVRIAYNIMGDCGTDLMHGLLCMPCGTRQAYSEAVQLGPLPGGNYGQSTATWTSPLLECTSGQCLYAAVCPCVVSHQTRVLLQPAAATDPWFDYLCVFPTAMYGQTRHTVGIGAEWAPHPVVEDFLPGMFCYPCGLNRALKEATAYRAKAATNAVMSKAMASVSSAVAGLRAKLPGSRYATST